jgi:hypothetical protein
MILRAFSSSRLPIGSSARISAGSLTRARAIATRCCSRPLNSDGRRLPRSQRPTVGRRRDRRFESGFLQQRVPSRRIPLRRPPVPILWRGCRRSPASASSTRASRMQLRFAPDSPLEGDGFEPSVPRHHGRRFRDTTFVGLKHLAAMRRRMRNSTPEHRYHNVPKTAGPDCQLASSIVGVGIAGAGQRAARRFLKCR